MSAEDEKPSVEEVSEAFLQILQREWTPADQERLQTRLVADPAYAKLYARIEAIWIAIDSYAESPELMRHREEAIAYACQVRARRWFNVTRRRRWYAVPLAAGFALALVSAWLVFPHGFIPGEYRTDVGEQRALELADRSRIVIDAATSLRVRYSAHARDIELKEGQAQFYVAHDPRRPFKVRAGNQTIIAIGTVFTVEHVDQSVHVAMMDGRVAVVGPSVPVTTEIDSNI